ALLDDHRNHVLGWTVDAVHRVYSPALARFGFGAGSFCCFRVERASLRDLVDRIVGEKKIVKTLLRERVRHLEPPPPVGLVLRILIFGYLVLRQEAVELGVYLLIGDLNALLRRDLPQR